MVLAAAYNLMWKVVGTLPEDRVNVNPRLLMKVLVKNEKKPHMRITHYCMTIDFSVRASHL
jgi:hypothetical protein